MPGKDARGVRRPSPSSRRTSVAWRIAQGSLASRARVERGLVCVSCASLTSHVRDAVSGKRRVIALIKEDAAVQFVAREFGPPPTADVVAFIDPVENGVDQRPTANYALWPLQTSTFSDQRSTPLTPAEYVRVRDRCHCFVVASNRIDDLRPLGPRFIEPHPLKVQVPL